MEKTNYLGVRGRIILAVATGLAALTGCDDSSPQVQTRIHQIGYTARQMYQENQRNKAIEAIANSNRNVEVNVNVNNTGDRPKKAPTFYDVVNLKDGRTIRGEILADKPSVIYISDENESVWKFSKNKIKSYENNDPHQKKELINLMDDTNDVVNLKDGRTIRGEILVDKPSVIYISDNRTIWTLSKDEIQSYENN
jgi:hypothetical protein